MEPIKDFDSFYNIKIAPQLDNLTKENKSADIFGVLMVIGLLLTIACFIATIIGTIESSGGFTLAVILLVLTILFIYKYTQKEDNYTDDFKKNVIAEIVNYLQPGIIYKPEGYVSSKEYKRSSLYRGKYDYYEGDDLIQGNYKGVNFYCSEIHTYNAMRAYGSITVFKGLFFVAGTSNTYAGGTYVWPQNDDQFARTLGHEHNLLPMPETIELHLHDTEFEKYFCVCSTDPHEARTILTPEMMALLVKYRKQLKRNISFSVVKGRCYVGIPIAQDLLEPTNDPTDREEIKKHFFTVLLVLSIINQLELSRLN